MNYGHFDEKNREYVITRPDTPSAWANYLGSPEYGAIISNNAGGTALLNRELTDVLSATALTAFPTISRADMFISRTWRTETFGRAPGRLCASLWTALSRNAATVPPIR